MSFRPDFCYILLMEYIVRKLELHKTISAQEGQTAADGTVEIREYRSLVAKNSLEPDAAEHLAQGMAGGEITPGKYLFVQGANTASENAYRDAAEKIWLEALWERLEFENDRILLRILSEDNKTVFQLFRKIKV
jgi:hypothetical protein